MSLIHLTSQFQLIMIVLKNLHPLIDLLQLLEKIIKFFINFFVFL